MATNYDSRGDTVTVPAPAGGVTAGLGYLIGSLFGIATMTALVGVNFPLCTVGLWRLAKVGSQAWAVGDDVYWDATNSRCSTDPGVGPLIGVATAVVASGAGDTTGYVKLNGSVRAVSPGVVDVTAATLAVTAAQHAGKTIKLNRVGGIAVTLPAAVGGGDVYDFIIGATFTSAAAIKVTGDDIMVGHALYAQDAADTAVMFETAADSDTVAFNGTTTGGYVGTRVKLIDLAANTWAVEVIGKATGSEATPFDATVSP